MARKRQEISYGVSLEEVLRHGVTDADDVRDLAIYGLRVRTVVPLPGWPPLAADPDAVPDVVIRREPVAAPDVPGDPHTTLTRFHGGEVTVVVRGVARYHVRGGTLIQVDPEPGAKPEDLQLYLGGAMLGTILHQRGVFPLHASSVAIDGRAIALAGPSGAGKSTLLATLVRRGATFVSDDVCALTGDAGAGFAVWPGAARAKLDPPALEALSQDPAALPSAGGTRGKLQLPLRADAASIRPLPLQAVYLLREGTALQLEPLGGLEAVTALLDETYLLGYASALGLKRQCFEWAARVAQSVQVCRCVRPFGMEHLNRLAEFLETASRAPGTMATVERGGTE